MNDAPESRRDTRRRFLQAGVTTGVAALAGCVSSFQSGEETDQSTDEFEQVGSGRSPFSDRENVGGTPMAEMPPLEGELTLYSGRGEPLVGTLVDFIEDRYPDLTVRPRYDSAANLVNQIETEGENSPADIFFSVNAGALGALEEAGRTSELPEEVLSMVPEHFRDPDGTWIGTSGRARAVPYNTDEWSEEDVPTDILAFPDQEQFAGEIGWAPTYSSFQAFVTAMRVLNGDETTREWLRGMMDLGVKEYSDEFLVSQAIADGEVTLGFANHYYVLRVQAGRENAPIDLTFTENDAGSMFNVAGASPLETADDSELASNFVRHLLSSEAQDYFSRETFEYPLVPEVDPVGSLPGIDELNPPEELDLTQLSDLEGTIDLMREVGVL